MPPPGIVSSYSAPLSTEGNWKAGSKTGKAESFCVLGVEPLVSGGSEAIKSAMVKGGITDLYYADYSVRFFFILGWYTVTAYGK